MEIIRADFLDEEDPSKLAPQVINRPSRGTSKLDSPSTNFKCTAPRCVHVCVCVCVYMCACETPTFGRRYVACYVGGPHFGPLGGLMRIPEPQKWIYPLSNARIPRYIHYWLQRRMPISITATARLGAYPLLPKIRIVGLLSFARLKFYVVRL